jgi:cobalt-zinc-cadmium efflux system outer membrane protein
MYSLSSVQRCLVRKSLARRSSANVLSARRSGGARRFFLAAPLVVEGLAVVGLAVVTVVFVAPDSCYAKPAAAEPLCTRTLTLEEFRAIALEKSPLVAEIDSQYAREVALAYDTEVFKNPEVQFEQVYTRAKLGGDSDPQTNASLGLPLRLSNFGAKQRVASLLRQAGDTQRRVRLLELTQRLVLQYNNIFVLQRSEELLAEAERRAAKKVSLIHQGVQKGLFTEGDHQLFEAEKYRLQAQLAGVRSSVAAAQAEVALMLGTPCRMRATTAFAVSGLPSSDELIAKARASGLSESARVDLLSSLSREQRRLAELDAIPEIAPRIVYQHTNDGGDFVGAGIAIPLPLFNRNRGAIDRASAELVAVERRQDLLREGGFEAQIRALRAAAQSSAEQATIFQRHVVPSFEGALRSQEQLYSQGKGNVLQVWQTLRTYNDAQRESLAVSLVAVSAKTQLSVLVGEEL